MRQDTRNAINSFLQLDTLIEREIYYLSNATDNAVLTSLKSFVNQRINPRTPNKNRISWGDMFHQIVLQTLALAPLIERNRSNIIHHYTCAENLIKANGLLASNFLNNRNDDQEVIYLLDAMKLSDYWKLRIFKSASLYRYNSFSYKKIDQFANQKYIQSCNNTICATKDTRLEIGIGQFYDNASRAGVCDYIFHGYVRYGLGGKASMMDFIGEVSKIINSSAPFYMRRDIETLINIASTFVKRKCGASDHPFTEENEYRFLYVDLKINAIPKTYIPINGGTWHTTRLTKPKRFSCVIDNF